MTGPLPLKVKRRMASAARTRHPDEDRQEMMSGLKEGYAALCDDILELVDSDPFAIPTSIPMVYNEAWGPQNATPNSDISQSLESSFLRTLAFMSANRFV